ncbi:MAG: hypothetical protein IJZ79_06915 [Bacilli bacterium]|nr:hypothetical protein [Bacilli bacterium]
MGRKDVFDIRMMQPDIDKSREDELKHLNTIRKNREYFVAGINWFNSGMNLEDSELVNEICFVRGFEKAKIEFEKTIQSDEKHKFR